MERKCGGWKGFYNRGRIGGRWAQNNWVAWQSGLLAGPLHFLIELTTFLGHFCPIMQISGQKINRVMFRGVKSVLKSFVILIIVCCLKFILDRLTKRPCHIAIVLGYMVQ